MAPRFVETHDFLDVDVMEYGVRAGAVMRTGLFRVNKVTEHLAHVLREQVYGTHGALVGLTVCLSVCLSCALVRWALIVSIARAIRKKVE